MVRTSCLSECRQNWLAAVFLRFVPSFVSISVGYLTTPSAFRFLSFILPAQAEICFSVANVSFFKTAFPKPLVLLSKIVTRQFANRKPRVREATQSRQVSLTCILAFIRHAGQVKSQSADGAGSRRGIQPVYFGSPRGIISLGHCHHELRSPRGRN